MPEVGWINRGYRKFIPAVLSLHNYGRQLNSMTVPVWRPVQEKSLIELWGNQYPDGDPQKNAQLLFGAENPPGTKHISGSQDHLGLLCPGINRLYYEGNYWPKKIDSDERSNYL